MSGKTSLAGEVEGSLSRILLLLAFTAHEAQLASTSKCHDIVEGAVPVLSVAFMRRQLIVKHGNDLENK